MQYSSTRDKHQKVPASKAVIDGLAAMGGLFVDEHLGKIQVDLSALQTMTYLEMATYLCKFLLRDFTDEQIRDCVHAAYLDTFLRKDITPVIPLGDDFIVELFHGPTAAFKDVALSFLPKLMTIAMDIQKVSSKVAILTATSGDTGKAALVGFQNVKNTKIIVFYPENGVSQIQKQQMVSQQGNNVVVCGIRGDFDDAQRGVKDIFKEVNHIGNYQLSSANSINIGRLVPQIVYYFHSYVSLVKKKVIAFGDEINVSVPSGNFGNILAGYYAKMLGLPIHTLICASNQNNVLYDFLRTGTYDRNRCMHKTISPSMDILVSSNLERLLYYLSGNDSDYINTLMAQLQTTGKYQVTDAILKQLQSQFYPSFTTDKQAKETIKLVYDTYYYVMDPHTAIAYRAMLAYQQETKDTRKTLVLATASPFKFTDAVYSAIFDKKQVGDEFSTMIQLSQETMTCIPRHLATLANQPILHPTVIDVEDMKAFVDSVLRGDTL